jgi:hypothetical protein
VSTQANRKSKRKAKPPKPLKRHYSGNHSKRFWDRVNRLVCLDHNETVYMLGCTLQNMEENVLRTLEKYEAVDHLYESD